MKTLFCSCELKYGLKVCMILINKERKRRLNAHRSFWKEKGHRNQLAIVQWYLEIADGWHPWRLSMLCGYKRYQHLSIQHLSDLLGGENSPVSTGASKGSGNKKKYLRRLKRKHIDLLSNLLQLKKLKLKGQKCSDSDFHSPVRRNVRPESGSLCPTPFLKTENAEIQLVSKGFTYCLSSLDL